MTQYILFDCDGVLVDSEIIAAQVLLRLLKPFGYERSVKRFMQRYAGMKDHDILASISEGHQIVFPAHFSHQLEVAIDDSLGVELQAISGVQQALQGIGLPKAVVSNSQLERVQNSLKVAQVTYFFGDRIYTAEMAGKPKPDPQIYRYALEQLGLQPHEALVVEDSLTGVTAAHEAGLKVIGFVGASHIMEGHAEKLMACGASATVEIMADLPRVLEMFTDK